MKPLLLALITLLLATSTGAVGAASAEVLTAEDHESIALLRETEANVQPLRDADAAFEQGLWEQAASLYAALPAEDEDAARYPLRRRCQALTELARRNEALEACRTLLTRVVPNAADLQAHVATLMLGSGRPSESDLREATLLLGKIENAEPDSVFSEAARCAIAERIADRDTFAACSAKLSKLAPESRLTRRFASSAAEPTARGAKWLKVGVFGGLLLAILLTLGHRFFSRRSRGLAASAFVVLLCWQGRATAQDFGIVQTPRSGSDSSGQPTAEEAHADSESNALNDEAKLLQHLTDLIKEAEALITEKSDWQTAVAKYNELVVTAPYIIKAWRRLCEGYSYLNMPVEGAHSCRQVLASPEANAWDHAMLVHHLLTGPDRSKAEVRAEAKQLADEAAAKAPTERWGYDAQCELALATNDLPALKACSAQLDRLAPDDRKTVAMLFSIALNEKHFTTAEKLIERARAGGMDEPSLANMKANLAQREPFLRRLRHSAPLGLGLGALAGVIALLGGYLMKARSRSRGRLGQSHG